MHYTLNIKGRLTDLSRPKVMGIVNATPDSFYAPSRTKGADAMVQRVAAMVADGADIIDVGACSTRPGSTPASEHEEMERLRCALVPLRQWEGAGRVAVSVDTFRPDVARMAVEELGADIINDVGCPDGGDGREMMRMASRLGVPYVLTAREPDMRHTLLWMAERVQRLRDMGQRDIIVDPGFGFGKTLEQNLALMGCLEQLQVLELPVLVGVSRKRMVCQPLGCKPEEALNGTTVLNTVALMKGASILRVHDVKEAAECILLSAYF